MTAGMYRERDWTYGHVSRAYWLPPGGQHNGLDASAWAPIADVPERLVAPVLAVLAAAEVPAYGGPVSARNPADQWRIWVGSMRYATAEDVLRDVLTRGLR